MADDPSASPEHSVVPHEGLSAAALRGLCEEFATRDGTDYGAVEKTLEEKIERLTLLLERGEARVVFDHETESVTIVLSRDL